MSWWSSAKTEPYRQFRFKVTFGAIGANPYHVMKVDKPSFKVGEYSHKIYNHQFNFPGRLVWDPITITFVDTPNGVQKKISDMLEPAGYAGPAGGQNATDGLSKFSATSALGDVVIIQMAPSASTGPNTHTEGNQWTLKNAFVVDAKFGSLDYGSEDAVQVTLTIRYDYAIEGTAGAAPGQG